MDGMCTAHPEKLHRKGKTNLLSNVFFFLNARSDGWQFLYQQLRSFYVCFGHVEAKPIL